MDRATPILAGMFIALCLSSALAWTWAIRGLVLGKPLLSLQPRSPAPWGFVDLLILIGCSFGAPLLTRRVVIDTYQLPFDVAVENIPADALMTLLLCGSLSTLIGTAAAMLIIAVRTGAKLRDFGFNLRMFPPDIGIGFVAFTLLAAPVLMLQLLLTHWFPTTHPLIEIIRQPGGGRYLALVSLSAAVIAPITEELQFRAILQGWFERVTLIRDDLAALLLGGRQPTQLAVRDDDVNQLASTTSDPTAPAETMCFPTERWPIVASALIFAALHIGHGPDPIPLFVLALGLGYLYHQTHRIVPCIVVHFLLNGWTMLILFVMLRFGVA